VQPQIEPPPPPDSPFAPYRALLFAPGIKAERRSVTIDGTAIDRGLASPLLTVVTPSFNSARTLERTIRSVLAQTHRQIEYVIIDGGSTDDTVEIIERYRTHLSFWRSGPDGGIGEAFNLGIAAAMGRYVAFVSSDDWMSPDQGGLAVAALENTAAEFAFGDLAMHALDGRVRYTMRGSVNYRKNMQFRMPQINHPTVVVRRAAYETVGPFNPRWRIAMDFDWHLRADILGIRGVYVPGLLGHMSEGGACDTGWQQGLREVREIAISHRRARVGAHAFYYTRVARARLRLAMQRLIPERYMHALHKWINPYLDPVRR
jgi:glycosyltransferase involved in cell wall biosynthesis